MARSRWMKLIEVVSQHRFDFTGVVQCEFCQGTQSLEHGYDDANFHNNVIPAIKCVKCDKRSVDVVPDGISDPGTQGAIPLKRQVIEREIWVKE